MIRTKIRTGFLVLATLLLIYGNFQQYQANKQLQISQNRYNETTHKALVHLIQAFNFHPLVDHLNKVVTSDKSNFSNHYIQAEKLAEELFDTLVIMSELSTLHQDNESDTYDEMTGEQEEFQEQILPLHLSGFFYSLKHKYYYFEEELQPEDKEVLLKLADGISRINQVFLSAKPMLENDIYKSKSSRS